MRNPERVLNSLSEHSKDSSYKFERLYRILFNEEMFYVAYQRIYAKEGNMTPGSDGQIIDNMSLSRIENLISALKDGTTIRDSVLTNSERELYLCRQKESWVITSLCPMSIQRHGRVTRINARQTAISH